MEKSYGWALERIKECIDEGGDDEEDIRVMLTLGEGADKHRLDVEQLSSDLEFILVDKARVGSDILHRVNNARPRGGVMMYAEVYRWFTETSGLGLMEQAAKLMQPKQATNEEDIAEAIDPWEEKINRLARHGEQ